eukprot:1160529-Pelagomonas_calceolata.AAC.12
MSEDKAQGLRLTQLIKKSPGHKTGPGQRRLRAGSDGPSHKQRSMHSPGRKTGPGQRHMRTRSAGPSHKQPTRSRRAAGMCSSHGARRSGRSWQHCHHCVTSTQWEAEVACGSGCSFRMKR